MIQFTTLAIVSIFRLLFAASRTPAKRLIVLFIVVGAIVHTSATKCYIMIVAVLRAGTRGSVVTPKEATRRISAGVKAGL